MKNPFKKKNAKNENAKYKNVEYEYVQPITAYSGIGMVLHTGEEVKEKIVIKVRCPYCGYLNDEENNECYKCGGRM